MYISQSRVVVVVFMLNHLYFILILYFKTRQEGELKERNRVTMIDLMTRFVIGEDARVVISPLFCDW